jgi:hypothetical protein
VETELVTEALEVEVAPVVGLNLAAAVVARVEQVLMPGVQPEEMEAVERMFSPLG